MRQFSTGIAIHWTKLAVSFIIVRRFSLKNSPWSIEVKLHIGLEGKQND